MVNKNSSKSIHSPRIHRDATDLSMDWYKMNERALGTCTHTLPVVGSHTVPFWYIMMVVVRSGMMVDTVGRYEDSCWMVSASYLCCHITLTMLPSGNPSYQ